MGEPKVYTTAEWGARAPRGSGLTQRPAEGVVVHNMEYPNREPAGDQELEAAFAAARRCQQEHMVDNGWLDTGQHFTISRGGVIMEGRHGSLAAARGGRVVNGAHASRVARFNRRWFGVELEGDYRREYAVTAEQWAALVDLCAWLSSNGGFGPERIIGHLEVKQGATDCPGRVMDHLDELRAAVKERISEGGGVAGGLESAPDGGARLDAFIEFMRRLDAPEPVPPTPVQLFDLRNGPYRKFRLTRYWVAELREDPSGVQLYDTEGRPLIKISRRDKADKLDMEGTARLPDGRVINHTERSGSHNQYRVLPPGVWGLGVRERHLQPFRSLAADLGNNKGKQPWKDEVTRGGPLVPFGTRVFVKELDGLVLPDGTGHDGWCEVVDTGSMIYGAHFDLFCGHERWARDGALTSLPELAEVSFQGVEEIPEGYSYGHKHVSDYKKLRPPPKG